MSKLLITNIGLLATPTGCAAKSGREQGEILKLKNAWIMTEDDLITEIDGRLKEQERSREKQIEKESTPGLAMLNHLKEQQMPQTPGRQIPKRREEAR